MRVQSVRDLAAEQGVRLPHVLYAGYPPLLSAADERGWFRFQRLYDSARHVVRGEDAMRRVVREAALDDGAEGSHWLEIQVDPTSYAPFVGGITPAMEIVLDEAASVNATAAETGSARVGVLMAASRTRHQLEARTLARLAKRMAGPGGVLGFGLSNDERRGDTTDFTKAFRIAEDAGLLLVPHGGELLGADAVAETLEALRPNRLGHGVRSVEDPRVLAAVVEAGVALEVCPGSNVSLGVYNALDEVPLRTLIDAGATIALGADDPLLFDSRLLDQYEAARAVHGLDDAQIAELARSSFRASAAPADVVTTALADIDAWLAAPPSLAPRVEASPSV